MLILLIVRVLTILDLLNPAGYTLPFILGGIIHPKSKRSYARIAGAWLSVDLA
jgi:hypothetical protein